MAESAVLWELPLGADGRWIHLDLTHPATPDYLNALLPPLPVAETTALLDEDTRPRALGDDRGALVFLRGVNLHGGAEPEDMISLRAFVDGTRLITLRRRDLHAIADMRAMIESGSWTGGPVATLVRIALRLAEQTEPVLDRLDDEVAAQEEAVLDEPEPNLRREIGDTRREAIILRRYLAPQREALRSLSEIALPGLGSVELRSLHETMDKVQRHVEDLDMLRDRAQVVKDELATILADRLNRNLYVLAILSAVFLPLTFVTGLLGVNLAGVPGAQRGDAFWWLTGGLVVSALLLLWVLRRLRWI